ncbi:MAG: heparan-alpha-glucosaminide N-acetyltransferase [Firmicutes bacterium]|nr:heparan-alpha-glucosaminide N-acetyltransferase [Bacillota bacterium]
METASSSPRRIHLMDEVRGFAVFCMVFYHAFYLIAFLFGTDWMAQVFRFFMPAEPYFAAAFILISGISSQLSRSNLLRGAKLLGIALIVTLATRIVVPEETIWFGVLHLLAVCMLLFGALQKPLAKIPFWPGFLLCAVLFFFSCGLAFGAVPYLGLPGVPALQLNAMSPDYRFGFPFGFRAPDFASADYFPLLPWLFMFLAGTFLGRFAKAGKFPEFMYKSRIPFFSWIGRHALIIYVLHQPVIYGIMLLITALRG